MFSIGEFSRITQLSIKAIRLYHEKGLLMPMRVDPESGYRYYDHAGVDRARVILKLRDMEFSLEDVGEMLENCQDEAEIVDFLEEHKAEIVERMSRYRNIINSLDTIIKTEKEVKMTLKHVGFEAEEKEVENILMAGVRYKGRYEDCEKAFSKIGKSMGRFICGKPFNLYYDREYREHDADIETCMPVRKGKEADGISVRELKGGKCVSLIHKGPYDELGRSYEKITAHVHEKGYKVSIPSREIYLKGPGMIFKGNPKNYLTELQMMIEE
ncbi:MerR family transcriptional regulator [Fibrobacterota bacterium]